MVLTASVGGVSPESVEGVSPGVEGNSDGKAVGNSPEVAAARATLERQWRESNNPASPPEIVAEAASASSQAWSLGSVGAIFGSVVKVAAQAITFSRQAIVKGLACIGISFDQAANTHASDAANDSAASKAIDWDSAAANQEICNLFAAEVKARGL
jgi:hypothetical protein